MPKKNSSRENRISPVLKMGFFGSLALLVVLNLFIRPHEPHFGLDKYPGFWALFGCLLAVLLAKAAKGAAHGFLGRDEDFYSKKQDTGTSV